VQARACHTLGLMTSFRDPAGGRPLLERSVLLATQAGDDWCKASTSQILAIAWILQDEFDTARPVLDEAYASAIRLGYRRGLAWHWFCLGWEAVYQGRLDEARALLARCIAASDEVGDPAHLAAPSRSQPKPPDAHSTRTPQPTLPNDDSCRPTRDISSNAPTIRETSSPEHPVLTSWPPIARIYAIWQIYPLPHAYTVMSDLNPRVRGATRLRG
jgi:hypothetical protein